MEQIADSVHIESGLGEDVKLCCAKNNKIVVETSKDDKNCLRWVGGQPTKSNCSRVNIKVHPDSGNDRGLSNRSCIRKLYMGEILITIQ